MDQPTSNLRFTTGTPYKPLAQQTTPSNTNGASGNKAAATNHGSKAPRSLKEAVSIVSDTIPPSASGRPSDQTTQKTTPIQPPRQPTALRRNLHNKYHPSARPAPPLDLQVTRSRGHEVMARVNSNTPRWKNGANSASARLESPDWSGQPVSEQHRSRRRRRYS